MEHLDDITTFFKSNLVVLKKINEIFGKIKDLDILYNITQNKELFMIYSRTECEKFADILLAFDNATPEKIIIYFAELELYGIFTMDNYYNFCKKINEKFEDGEDINISIQQLILANQKQKLVFVSTNNSIDKIRNYVKEYLGADISVNTSNEKTEITVLEPTAIDFNSAREIYDKLYNYVYKKDKNIASKMVPLQLLHDRDGYKYIAPSANDSFKITSIDDLSKVLKSIPAGNNIQINIINGGNVINNNIVKVKVDKYSETKKWIENNPPEDRELTTDYYNRYLNSSPKQITSNNVFGKLVRDEGFQIIQGTNCRRWVQ